MAVDLGNLVDALKREVSPPGDDLFPNATDDEYLGNLMDAFWECVIDGVLSGYSVDDNGSVAAVDGVELGRDLQQLIVIYAGFRIVRNHMRNIKTKFRAAAGGGVEYETEQSATLLREVMQELRRKRDIVLARLSDLGQVDDVYIDAIVARDDSMRYGQTWWVDG